MRNWQPGDEPVPGRRLIEVLGSGGFGVVWSATAPGGFRTALKFIPIDDHDTSGLREFLGLWCVKDVRDTHLAKMQGIWFLDQEDAVLEEGAVEDLLREVKADTASPMDQTLVVGTRRPTTIVVGMEQCDKTLGQVLEEYVSAGRTGIPVDELLEYMTYAAKGIDYLNCNDHASGAVTSKGKHGNRKPIIHGDIKPANIMIDGSGVKIVDYGVAQYLASDDLRKTLQLKAGTIAYMAPERLDQRDALSSDQYALAITYCELRLGRLPFAKEATTSQMRLMREISHGRLDLEGLSPAEQAVIQNATSPLEENRRYASCVEFVNALKQAVSGEEQARTRQDRTWRVMFAAVACIAMAIAAIWYGRNGGPTTPLSVQVTRAIEEGHLDYAAGRVVDAERERQASGEEDAGEIGQSVQLIFNHLDDAAAALREKYDEDRYDQAVESCQMLIQAGLQQPASRRKLAAVCETACGHVRKLLLEARSEMSASDVAGLQKLLGERVLAVIKASDPLPGDRLAEQIQAGANLLLARLQLRENPARSELVATTLGQIQTFDPDREILTPQQHAYAAMIDFITREAELQGGGERSEQSELLRLYAATVALRDAAFAPTESAGSTGTASATVPVAAWENAAFAAAHDHLCRSVAAAAYWVTDDEFAKLAYEHCPELGDRVAGLINLARRLRRSGEEDQIREAEFRLERAAEIDAERSGQYRDAIADERLAIQLTSPLSTDGQLLDLLRSADPPFLQWSRVGDQLRQELLAEQLPKLSPARRGLIEAFSTEARLEATGRLGDGDLIAAEAAVERVTEGPLLPYVKYVAVIARAAADPGPQYASQIEQWLAAGYGEFLQNTFRARRAHDLLLAALQVDVAPKPSRFVPQQIVRGKATDVVMRAAAARRLVASPEADRAWLFAVTLGRDVDPEKTDWWEVGRVASRLLAENQVDEPIVTGCTYLAKARALVAIDHAAGTERYTAPAIEAFCAALQRLVDRPAEELSEPEARAVFQQAVWPALELADRQFAANPKGSPQLYEIYRRAGFLIWKSEYASAMVLARGESPADVAYEAFARARATCPPEMLPDVALVVAQARTLIKRRQTEPQWLDQLVQMAGELIETPAGQQSAAAHRLMAIACQQQSKWAPVAIARKVELLQSAISYFRTAEELQQSAADEPITPEEEAEYIVALSDTYLNFAFYADTLKLDDVRDNLVRASSEAERACQLLLASTEGSPNLGEGSPQLVNAYIAWGNALEDLAMYGKYDMQQTFAAAVAKFRLAEQSFPLNRPQSGLKAKLNLGRARWRSVQHSAVPEGRDEQELKQALADLAGAIALADRAQVDREYAASELIEDAAEALFWQSRVFEQLGDVAAARASVDRAIDLASRIQSGEMLVFRVQQAKLADKAGDGQAVVSLATELAKRIAGGETVPTRVLFELIPLIAADLQDDEGQSIADQLLKGFPETALGRAFRARLLMIRGEYAAAKQVLDGDGTDAEEGEAEQSREFRTIQADVDGNLAMLRSKAIQTGGGDPATLFQRLLDVASDLDAAIRHRDSTLPDELQEKLRQIATAETVDAANERWSRLQRWEAVMLSRHLSESIYWRINVATIVVFLDKQGVLQDDATQLAKPIRRALEVVLPLRGEYVPLPSFQERELGTVLIPYLSGKLAG